MQEQRPDQWFMLTNRYFYGGKAATAARQYVVQQRCGEFALARKRGVNALAALTECVTFHFVCLPDFATCLNPYLIVRRLLAPRKNQLGSPGKRDREFS